MGREEREGKRGKGKEERKEGKGEEEEEGMVGGPLSEILNTSLHATCLSCNASD